VKALSVLPFVLFSCKYAFFLVPTNYPFAMYNCIKFIVPQSIVFSVSDSELVILTCSIPPEGVSALA
jgi:hypothetical protein